MIAAAALAAFCLSAVLGGRRPLSLEGWIKKWYLAAAAAVDLFAVFCPGISLADVLALNVLFWMTVTDLREQVLYDIHFYVLLLGGLIGAFFQSLDTLMGRSVLFLLILGALFLIARKNKGLGTGDSRTFAVLALYFPLSGWIEIMLLSLGSAMLWGLWGVLRKKRTMKTEFPFLPFLLAGTMLEYVLR